MQIGLHNFRVTKMDSEATGIGRFEATKRGNGFENEKICPIFIGRERGPA